MTPRPTMREIQLSVAAHYGVLPDDLMGRSHQRKYAWPRQMAMFLSRTLAGKSYEAIGVFYDRDHSTVQYATAVIPARTASDAETWFALERLKAKLAQVVERRHAYCSEVLAA